MIDSGWPPAYAQAAGSNGPTIVLTFRLPVRKLDAPRFARPSVLPAGVVPQHRRHGDRRSGRLGRDRGPLTESYCLLAPKKLVALVDRPSELTGNPSARRHGTREFMHRCLASRWPGEQALPRQSLTKRRAVQLRARCLDVLHDAVVALGPARRNPRAHLPDHRPSFAATSVGVAPAGVFGRRLPGMHYAVPAPGSCECCGRRPAGVPRIRALRVRPAGSSRSQRAPAPQTPLHPASSHGTSSVPASDSTGEAGRKGHRQGRRSIGDSATEGRPCRHRPSRSRDRSSRNKNRPLAVQPDRAPIMSRGARMVVAALACHRQQELVK